MRQILIRSGFFLITASCVWAQAFEVVSIKRSLPDTRPSNSVSPGGRFTCTSTTLRYLILGAYNVGPHQLTGTSGWMDSERYDVVGKAPDGSIRNAIGRPAEWSGGGGTTSNWTALDPNSPDTKLFRKMMQTLLADRFQLQLHRETRELPAYALTAGKGGSKLRQSKPGALRMKWGMGRIDYQGAPLSMLTNTLTQLTGRIVVDQTGLTGDYDLTLQWTPDEAQSQMFRRAGDWAANGEASIPDASGPSLFTALKEQLGLRLEAAKAPIEMLVVDHADRPSEN